MARDMDFIFLNNYTDLETEAEKREYVETLEVLILRANRYLNKHGEPLYSDAIYDILKERLTEHKPDSDALKLWTEDDASVPFNPNWDRFLIEYPMTSINTIKSYSDKPFKDFINMLPVNDTECIAAVKGNGHGIRVVFEDGNLVKATSRGRSTNGKDLTKQFKVLLGEFNEGLKDLGVVEIRGEVMLPFTNLDKARVHNPAIKSAFSGVASMLRASATDDEIKLLDCFFYKVLSDDMEFYTLQEEYEFIESIGYKKPLYKVFNVTRFNFEQELRNVMAEMEKETNLYDFYLDGVVISINDHALFKSFGEGSTFRYGKLAMKVGKWAQDGYVGVVDHVEWSKGKSKKTPVAILEEPVLTGTGNSVSNVPLYAPVYILILEAYPGNTINFRYGGEAGVIPMMPDGRLVTDDSVTSELLDEFLENLNLED